MQKNVLFTVLLTCLQFLFAFVTGLFFLLYGVNSWAGGQKDGPARLSSDQGTKRIQSGR